MGAIDRGGLGEHRRRWLRQGLGGLWLLDALLQLQPAMFGPALPHMFVAAAAGSPRWLAALVRLLAHAFAAAPVLANGGAVCIQLAIGVLLLAPDPRWWRRGLWLSVAWGLGVWVAGEALGGLLAPGANLLTGAPGSVLLYVLAAALLLMPDDWLRRHGTDALGWLIGGYWFLGATLMVVSGGFAPGFLAAAVMNAAATPQPVALSNPMERLAAFLLQRPELAAAVLFVVFLALGELWAAQRREPWVVALSLATLAALWWFGMDFGVLGGLGTDPNTAPILALCIGAAAGRPAWTPVRRRAPAAAAPAYLSRAESR